MVSFEVSLVRFYNEAKVAVPMDSSMGTTKLKERVLLTAFMGGPKK